MTNQEIKTVGQTIAQETQIGGNTAARVGGVVEGIGVALDNKDAANGYYQAIINGGTITVNAPNYLLGSGGNLRIKMPSAGTTASTLTIGNANAVQLWYNGAAVSAQNTWDANEIISVFYDGTRFMASNSQGGGGNAEKINYNNSQSGLASDNVQGALDEVNKQGYVDIGVVGIGVNIKYFINNNGIWGDAKTTHRIVEVKAGEHYRITANSEQSTVYRWLKSSTVNVNHAADVSDIDGVKHLLVANDSAIVHVPSDAHYMYLQGKITNSSGTITINYAPSEVMKLQYAPDAIQSVQEDVVESWYKKVIGTRTFSFSGAGSSYDTHGLNLIVGKKYQIVISTSVDTIDSAAVRLYQTSSSSSSNITLGVVPAGVSSYTINYTPDVNKNYQYLSIYNNSAEVIDMDVIIRVLDDVSEKINIIDSDIYLEKPFEQGTIGMDGTTLVDVDTLIRSADFISIPKQVTIQAKDGYYIRRVFAYNPDGTLNALLNTDAVSSYTLHDPSLKYKFTVQKGANEDIEINPDEDCMVWTSVKKLVGGSDTQGVAALNAGIRRIFVAAADSTPAAKAIADYQCTGTNDELVIQEAINSLTYGGTVQLLDGQYNIDSFQTEITVNGVTEHIAIFVTGDGYISRVVNLVGTTENKSYNSHYGVHIHVSQAAIDNMNDTDVYTCIRGTGKRPSQYGTYTRVTNMNFANFYLYIGDAEKKIRGISCAYFGSSYIKQVGVYTEHYFYYRFNHLKPSTPVEGSVGVIANAGSNDEMARIGWDTLNCGGMYIGVMTESIDGHVGIDHLIMQTCTFARCVYGMYFKVGTPKTMTIINSCDEGCIHLPYFGGSGHITAIDFNVERFNNAYYPDDPTGSTEFYAVEETPGSWIGTIEYTLQGWSGADAGNAGQHFWKNDGSGKGIRTRNLNSDHTGYSRPNCGEYLEQYFDTATNTWKTWNGSAWV